MGINLIAAKLSKSGRPEYDRGKNTRHNRERILDLGMT